MKKILTIAFLFTAMTSAFAQPAYDDCANALVIPFPLPYVSSNCGLTNINATPSVIAGLVLPQADPTGWQPAAPNTVQKDVWFTFTTPVGNPIDINILIQGCGPNPLTQPKYALYAGNCGFLVEHTYVDPVTNISVPATAISFGSIDADVLGLSPGTQYFLRVDNGLTGTPIAGGDFTLEITEYCAPITMTNGSSNFCNDACILYDNGGPFANYPPGTNLTYTICPPNPQGCLLLNFANYDISDLGDGLDIYDGTSVTAGGLLAELQCTGTNFTVEAPSGCATIVLQSNNDGIEGSGFELSWVCSSTPCTPTVTSDCNSATPFASLPFTGNYTTCGAGNNYDATDACGSGYMNSEDYIFAYTSPGNECISVTLTNTGIETGVFVMDGCPNADATNCLASAESPTGNPFIGSVQIDDPGVYYILISGTGCPLCTAFDIVVDQASCPMQVNPNVTALALAETIAGPNVDITNIQLNCPPGAYGVFSGGPGAVNIDGGIILSTGFADDAEGPNQLDGTLTFPGQDANTPIGSPGDALLSGIINPTLSTVDACVLEFDVYAPIDTLSFNYVFMSEEYLEFVGSVYNDIFGFWIQGPGILDGNTDLLISAVPNTAGTPITVSTVNPNTNNQYYINNPAGEVGTAYDGYTTLLTAKTPVTPCNTYHLRLAIADGIDQFFDSGVLIEQGSLFNQGVELEIAGATVGNALSCAENCLDGTITISLVAPQADTVFVPLDIQGTAGNGIDYDLIPTMLVFPPGVTSITIPINPIVDGIAEPTENIVIYLYDECSGPNTPSDSAIIFIQDDISGRFTLPSSLDICGQGLPLPLVTSGPDNFNYAWSPAEGLSDSTARNPIAYPGQNTTYTVIAGNGICFDTLSIDVNVATIDISLDTLICNPGSPVQMFAVTNQPNSTWNWTPGATVSDSTISAPVASPTETTVYNVQVTTPICVIDTFITISVFDGEALVTAAQTICNGDTIQIGAALQPNLTYEWTPADGLSDATAANPFAFPSVPTIYTLTVTQEHCDASNTVSVNVGGQFTIDPIDPVTIYQGESVDITASVTPLPGEPNVGPVSYVWTPTASLTGTNNQVTASPLETTTYTIEATSDAGCTDGTGFEITVLPPDYAFPNAFAPGSASGENQTFKPLIAGIVDVQNFQIFNRWGELVFDNGDIDKGWDGTVNGEDAPQDTYIYVATILLPGATVPLEFKGEVLLVR
jgi:gliding motility-associated-like protein